MISFTETCQQAHQPAFSCQGLAKTCCSHSTCAVMSGQMCYIVADSIAQLVCLNGSSLRLPSCCPSSMHFYHANPVTHPVCHAKAGRTCATASMRPCVGRTEPRDRGIQSIWFLNTAVMVPCCSGHTQTWASDHKLRLRSSELWDVTLALHL